MASSLRDLEEYDAEGEIPTRIASLEMYPNTKDTDQIGLDMLNQADITYYIKRSIDPKKTSASNIQSSGISATNSSKNGLRRSYIMK